MAETVIEATRELVTHTADVLTEINPDLTRGEALDRATVWVLRRMLDERPDLLARMGWS